MSFEITKLSTEDTRQALNTPLVELYDNFANEFDRVCRVKSGWSALEASDDAVMVKANRWDDSLDHVPKIADNLRASRKIEIGKVVLIGEPAGVYGQDHYASYVILKAAGVKRAEQTPDKNEDTEGPQQALWVPGVSVEYQSLIPQPWHLARDLGISHSLRVTPFHDFGNNRRTVFETDTVTAANEDSYDGTVVKPVLLSTTRSMAAMPDAVVA